MYKYSIMLWNDLSRCATAGFNSIKEELAVDLSVGIVGYQDLYCENRHDVMLSLGWRD